MFEMFETYGKQVTAFITEAKTLLEAIKVQNELILTGQRELREQQTRIEVSIAALDIEPEEIVDEIVEEVAEEIAPVIEEVAEEVAIEEVSTPEEIIVQETIPPAAPEVPPTNEPTQLPETPVPEEPIAEPQEIPIVKRKRTWI